MPRKKDVEKTERTEEELTEKKKKEQVKQENKLLRNFLIGIVVLVVVVVGIIILYNSVNSFKYQGLEFEVVKFCDSGPPCLITYQTSLPVKVNGKNVSISTEEEKTNDYNFYLRNDPRDLEVPFNGTVNLKPILVFNSTEDFICGGYGGIAGANLVQLYNILGVQVIKDEKAPCDFEQDRYMVVNLQPGNETSIEQYAPSCYNININNCEILEGTEKFMIETFLEIDKVLKNS